MDVSAQLKILERGCGEVISKGELSNKLAFSIKSGGLPLKIKAGFDPTSSDIHLGHTVLLRKLRQFQDLGHIVYFLIGDFTALIGDPAGQNKTRPAMTPEQIKINAATYREQAFKILDPQKTQVVFNSVWFSGMSLADVIDLMSHSTVSQILTRADFRKRLSDNMDIRAHEFLYPLLQAYDSVYLKADVELGGTDQKFNLLLGRELQRDFGQPEQVVITMPLLEGVDGINKMSKSLDNYIGINDTPGKIFGKIMSISDELMYKYYELLTDFDLLAVKGSHPKEAKERLAEIIISQYYNMDAARKARSEFVNVFKNKETPEDLPVFEIKESKKIIDLLMGSGIAKSKNEARRLVQQGGVIFNEEKIIDENFIVLFPGVLKVGSRRFLKIIKI